MTPKSTRLMRLCCILLLLCVGSMVFSQTRRITGKVIGADGQPVPGATIAVKGSNAVTVTAADGLTLPWLPQPATSMKWL